MRYVRVKVTRDVNTVYNRAIPEWEVPVLEFIFDEGNVQRTGDFEKVVREWPAPGFEYDRLTRAYGADPQSGVPYVASVYGNAQAGIRALAKAMESAKAEESEDAVEVPAPKARRGKTRSDADSLLA